MKEKNEQRVPLPIDSKEETSAESVASRHVVKELPFTPAGFTPYKAVYQSMRVKKGKSRHVNEPIVNLTASHHARLTAACTAHMHYPQYVCVDCNLKHNIIRISPAKNSQAADFKLSYSSKDSNTGSAIFSSRTLLASMGIPAPGKLIQLKTTLFIEKDGLPTCYAEITDEIMQEIVASAKEREQREEEKAQAQSESTS